MPRETPQGFEGRLAALSRADRLISSQASGRPSLASMLEQELMPIAGDPSRYTLEGPSVVLHPDCAFALSLLFHELATNAARHGSLSTGEGRLAVCWDLEDGDLCLTWTETGGPPVRRPSSPGFGSLLVTYAAVKLQGSANLLYLPSGLRCELRVSLRACWPRRRGAMRLGNSGASAVPARAM